MKWMELLARIISFNPFELEPFIIDCNNLFQQKIISIWFWNSNAMGLCKADIKMM